MNILYSAAPGATAPSGTSTATGSGFSFIFLLVMLFAMFYFLIILPQRRREKQFQQMISQLKRGDTVVTVGGIVGKVIDIKKDTVKIKTAMTTELEVTKRSIASVFREREEEQKEQEKQE
ncbi:membrane protein [Pseudothermotoga hypogea DSM 11164 = NBRC 106472]|uniref:Membrane protein n=1 Tax=Pseudothermotoga hypogea DSM 11164 = NBRC 106472 TaxID=1123384 RepID=A0A0X1KPV6_9THEM|nr:MULTISPECIES: preprotein translocase subunit YajC [Pseudothermotoga]AJC73283.1 membrane protein [Pseudothermotoga hypogea DSM 11164 = NBRC 106472]MBC7123809.1 preprotein translocase subunit YajC [Pseudothermotoga sp.]MDI6863860.1 preprotein translocase subunit YajC [Pseudothermotoga sp.]